MMKRWLKRLWIPVLVVLGALVLVLLYNPLLLLPEGDVDDAAPDLETTEVAIRDLEEDFEASGNVVFVESFDVAGSTAGTLSEIRDANSPLAPGDVLYVRDDQPVVFLAGAVPVWRSLAVDDEGVDVQQLEQNLVALGYVDESEMTVDETFTSATQTAVKRWQEDLGVAETGIVERDTIVFGPENARVGAVAGTVGTSTAGTRLMTVAADEREIVFELSAEQRIRLDVGDEVNVRLPDRSQATATVAEFGLAGEGIWQAKATVSETAADLPVGDVVPVTVSWTDVVSVGVKTVPASAVLRLDSGQYVVEVLSADRNRLVPVSVGERFGTFVEIDGDINEGERVVAP